MKRHEFLRYAAAIAAALSGWPRGAHAATAEKQLGVWLGGKRPLDEWRTLLTRLRDAGVTMILPNARDIGLDTLAAVTPIAGELGLRVHAWHMVMWSFEPLQQHPEWYAVNRSGDSTAVKPPYVDYYRFLCPVREPVQEWVLEGVRRIASVPGLASVHLDYIRFPDVILPEALWPKYGIIQDREYPQYDYCYCDVCRAGFRARTGIDPMEITDPQTHPEWLQFRYDAISRLVTRCHEAVHAAGTSLSAAVFPTPDIARALVRQDWTAWRIDALMPMLYHGFYNQSVDWLAPATRAGVRALAGRVPLHAGLYLPDLNPDQLTRAARLALDQGAAGIVLFDAGALRDGHWAALSRLLS